MSLPFACNKVNSDDLKLVRAIPASFRRRICSISGSYTSVVLCYQEVASDGGSDASGDLSSVREQKREVQCEGEARKGISEQPEMLIRTRPRGNVCADGE